MRDDEMRMALAALRDDEEPLAIGFTDRVLEVLDRPGLLWRRRARVVAHDARARYAAVSVGGAVLGAAAALVVRRAARRRVAA
jgi:hypothetical protein